MYVQSSQAEAAGAEKLQRQQGLLDEVSALLKQLKELQAGPAASTASTASASEGQPTDPFRLQAEAAVPTNIQEDNTAAEGCLDIRQAVVKGNVDAVRHFLAVDPGSIERKGGDYGSTPLHLAVENNHIKVVALLVTSGASLEAKDSNTGCPEMPMNVYHDSLVRTSGGTPLHWAAWDGYADVAEKLLSVGAEVDAVANFGSTALGYAASRGHAEVVTLLLNKCASVEAKDVEGFTALHGAANHGWANVVEQLISAGAQVEAAANEGRDLRRFCYGVVLKR
eukprot:s330_g24.t1